MINKEKTLELSELTSINDDERYYQSRKCEIYDKCIEIAEWKDKKALEACEKLLDKISTYKYNVVGISKDHLLNEFLKYLNE